jgi:CRISPR-associated protein Csd1
MILEDAVRPYFQKLSSGSREYYRRLISEITVCFQDEDQGKMNQRLKESYLLGYYLQRAEFNKKKEEGISNEQLAEQN